MDPNDFLNVLEQQPGLSRLYTQICFCFSVADASSHSAIVDTLTTGLERLSASFQWLAGQVVNEGSGEGNSGTFKIEPFEKIPRLVVKDLRHDSSIPTMDALRRANFPFRMLDESIIAPRKTLPGSPNEPASEPAPVFLLQATFITGGLLLTFVGQHNTMDMTGQGQIIHLLSKACHNETFTSEDVSSGNIARRNLIPLFDDSHKRDFELADQVVKPNTPLPVSSGPDGLPAPLGPPKSTWAYFAFHATSLAALKSLAMKTVPSGYISTDDTLSAFIWKSITRSRLPRLTSTAVLRFARAVDARRYLGISPTYLGLMQNMAYTTYSLQKLCEEPLGVVASQLRSAVDPKTSDVGYRTRCLAAVLSRAQDKSIVDFIATLDLSADIMLSSWARLDCYELDFNFSLGKPESVRRPQFLPVESLIYLMPKTRDGDIAVGLCLRDEDMERLRADEEFAKYARYIG